MSSPKPELLTLSSITAGMRLGFGRSLQGTEIDTNCPYLSAGVVLPATREFLWYHPFARFEMKIWNSSKYSSVSSWIDKCFRYMRLKWILEFRYEEWKKVFWVGQAHLAASVFGFCIQNVGSFQIQLQQSPKTFLWSTGRRSSIRELEPEKIARYSDHTSKSLEFVIIGLVTVDFPTFRGQIKATK